MTNDPLAWPDITQSARPWTRWWWLGNDVDAENITRLLEEYHRAGIGGVEITPIYGVEGQESREIPYLSPEWLEMLAHTLKEAARLGMGVDMATGTGWPFGGPHVSDEDALDKLTIETREANGEIRYTARTTWAGRMVKRPAPGGEGKCINPFSRKSLMNYLRPFDTALRGIPLGAIRCQFHDSFEYLADWSPNFLEEFAARRGYDLSGHLPALAGDGNADTVARVKTDYRETIGELLLENFTQPWTEWSHGKGCLSRNQAHGSPGNLLDLYGAADIPETEIFGDLPNPLSNKFASSAAHVIGKPLTSSESCTWLGEHFTVSLAQAKRALDGLLLAGINHILYHGTAYSPADAAWPGWLFYASTTFAPQDPIWRDFPALNAYIARCQSLLQAGEPDNDILLYWPIYDLWHKKPEQYMFEINGGWLCCEAISSTARSLWDRNVGFDYLSDRQLAQARVSENRIHMPGGSYRAIVVPACDMMPAETLRSLFDLAAQGAPVVFQDRLPCDVPGLRDLSRRRKKLHSLLENIPPGAILAADLGEALGALDIHPGVSAEGTIIRCIRRKLADGRAYFLVNEGPDEFDGWISLDGGASAIVMDPMTGETGAGEIRRVDGTLQVRLQLAPGASLFVKTLAETLESETPRRYPRPCGAPVVLEGAWDVDFLEGGRELPPSVLAAALSSWTDFSAEAERFAGTARYAIGFDAPSQDADEWWLDLGSVRDSARVRLNGTEIGTLIDEPFRIRLGTLEPQGNLLEIEVTNLAANRIRDMDRRGERWKIFQDINIVDRHYKPFDASSWPVRESGLLGPVRLIPMAVSHNPE
jgi:hypothetical protein